jgi:hypothetical protein
MAAYTSKQYTNSPRSMVGAFPGNLIGFEWEITWTATTANGDTYTFGTVPKGFRVFGGCLEATDIDTNASPTVTINVGDSGSGTRLFAASTAGQAGTADRALAVAGQHYLFTDDTVITGSIPTGPATGAVGGTIILSLYGRFEGSAS